MHARSENLHDGARSAPEICDIFMNRRANSSYFHEPENGPSPGPGLGPSHLIYWNSRACARAARNLHATNLWYWYVYSQSIFRIQNSEYAFHSKCVFSVDFQKHASEYEVVCF